MIMLVAGIGAVGASAARADVVVNEVNCEGTDWVELVNTSGSPAEISGWLLTDEPLGLNNASHRMLFSSPTVIGPNDDLVVERTTDFPFGISCDDTIRLADAGESLVDETTIAAHTVPTDTWGRYPNGTGPFTQTAPTRGAPNEPSGGGGPAPDIAAWMFDPASVVEIDLTLPPESIEALEEEPTEYQDGVFSLTTTGASYGPLEVGARLKGGLGSFRPLSGKAAFKVKFSHSIAGQRFLGLKTLTLNNMVQDASMVHEVLAYEAFRAAGIAAPRTGYAYVRVNGQDYGVYLNVETLDDVALPRWFDSTQHLYEGAYGNDVLPGGAGAFEVDEGSETDRSDLEALIAAVAGSSGAFADRVAAVADLQQITRMWAVERYIGHWDGYAGRIDGWQAPNNFYLHSDSAGRFQMLPWGTDQTFRERMAFGDWGGGVMVDHCLGDPGCAATYRDAVGAVSELIAGLDLDGLAASTAAALAPWQELDPRREHSLEEIDAEVASTREFLRTRSGDVAAWLAPDTLGLGADLRIRSAIQTRITRAPKGQTTARVVKLGFRSNQSGSRFHCRLDERPFRSCRSPEWIRAGAGRHRFQVRASSSAGDKDLTPAEARFEVVGPG